MPRPAPEPAGEASLEPPEPVAPEPVSPEPVLPETALPELDPVIHGKLRLAVLSLLSTVEETDFTWLRAKTGATDGNLGAQMQKLEEAGYVAMEKRFVQRKPQTLYRMTETGRKALTGYVQALKQLLGAAIDA